MVKRDPRVDKIIASAAPFAKPILKRIRTLVHKNVPRVEESIKWGMPSFLYNDKILCGMAPFKAHCALFFWAGREVTGGKAVKGSMGQLGKLKSVDDLPSNAVLSGFLKKARKLNEAELAKKKKKPAKRAKASR